MTAKTTRYLGGHGAYTLLAKDMTKKDAGEIGERLKRFHPDYSIRTIKQKNGKYALYSREWKPTPKKQRDAAYAANRKSVERMNKEFRKDLPPWAD